MRHSSCPVTGCWLRSNNQLDAVIPHLNDVHRWFRERIAEWVETIEAKGRIQPEDELAMSELSLVKEK